ncbi:MAG: nitronate monooxygenase [Polyangiales bacterium]
MSNRASSRPKAKRQSVAPKAAEAKAEAKVAVEAEVAAEPKRESARAPKIEVSEPEAPKAKGLHPTLQTRATKLFGVQYPIVQTGMGWVSGPRLTAATSGAGGLGILAAATMTYDELVSAIASVKSKTDKPFGVNLRADQADAEQRCDLLIREKVKVASFAQAPGEKLIKKLKDAGLVVMPTIGARRHAEKVAKWGVDAVIAQGQEGGGHTGSVPTSLLIQDVCRAVDIPVIAAGGFSSGQGLVAALAYGASGIAMGTRFLLTQESQVPADVKKRYLAASVNDTVVTKAIDGYPQRVIRTELIDELEKAGPLKAVPLAFVNAISLARITGTKLKDLMTEGLAMKRNQELSWAQLAMAANAPMLTKATMVDGKLEAGILPTGQVVGVIDELPTVADLLGRIIREAEETLGRLGA